MTDADLVVVGCGPVGLMAAIRATQQGLSVIVQNHTDPLAPSSPTSS